MIIDLEGCLKIGQKRKMFIMIEGSERDVHGI